MKWFIPTSILKDYISKKIIFPEKFKTIWNPREQNRTYKTIPYPAFEFELRFILYESLKHDLENFEIYIRSERTITARSSTVNLHYNATVSLTRFFDSGPAINVSRIGLPVTIYVRVVTIVVLHDQWVNESMNDL